MQKALTLILIASMLIVGCDKNIDNIAEESTVDLTEASVVIAETALPESTVTEISETITDEKPQFEHDWQVLYYDELTKYIKNSAARFNIYDLDGDGTPELLFSEGGYHAAGGALYAVHMGELIYLGTYGGWGEFEYDFERNYIHSSFWQMGSGFLTICSFENSKTTVVVSLYFYDGSFPSAPEKEYKINDEEVSEDVFNAEYEKYSFESREDFIVRKYEVTQSTIESVLRQYE